MIESDWAEYGKTVTCPHCQTVGVWEVRQCPPTSPHEKKVLCGNCGVFSRFLSKDKNVGKRERLPNGTTDAVWKEYRGHCACCGIHEDQLAVLGIGRTIQHSPPYDLTGNKSHLLPFCTWCQARASAEMIRMRTALRKLKEGTDEQFTQE
jgi:hypothetical protein